MNASVYILDKIEFHLSNELGVIYTECVLALSMCWYCRFCNLIWTQKAYFIHWWPFKSSCTLSLNNCIFKQHTVHIINISLYYIRMFFFFCGAISHSTLSWCHFNPDDWLAQTLLLSYEWWWQILLTLSA